MARRLRALFIPLVVLGLLEAGARLLDPPDPRFPRGTSVFKTIGGLDEREVNEIIVGDADLFWRMRPRVSQRRWLLPLWPDTRSNSLGLRDHEFAVEKQRDEFRILCLGDSCTYGSGVPMAAAYPQQLEEILSLVDRSRPYEVINAGFPGYTVFQGYQFLRRHGHALRPDVVIASFGFNENGYWSGRSDEDTHRKLNPPLLNLLLNSRLLRLLARPFIAPAGFAPTGKEDLRAPGGKERAEALERRMSPGLYGDYLRRLTALASELGAKSVLILHPTRPLSLDPATEKVPEHFDLLQFQLSQQHVQDIRDELRRLCREQDQPLLDMEHSFDQDPDRYFIDNCHLTVAGCKQQARLLLGLLQEERLLPPPVE